MTNMIQKKKVSKFVNGATLLTDVRTDVHSVALYILFKVGSNSEAVEISGISHFIEHMLFKGTEKRNAKEIAEACERIGASINAYTSREVTVYHGKVLKEYFYTLMEVFADMCKNSVFNEGEVERERNVIKEELKEYADDPSSILAEELEAICYKGTSAGMKVGGTIESVNSINRDAMLSFFEKHYVNSQMIIGISGNFDEEKAIEEVRKLFCGNVECITNSLHSINKNVISSPELYVAPNFCGGMSSISKDVEQVHVGLALPAVSYSCDNYYTQRIANIILGGGMSSRLFHSIRERLGLAYAIYSSIHSYARYGYLTISSVTSPENAKQLVEQSIFEMKKMVEDVNREEIEKGKNRILSSIIMSSESSSARASHMVTEYAMFEGVVEIDDIIAKVQNISVDEIKNELNSLVNSINTGYALSIVGNISSLDVKTLLSV
ncbi:M16 family metallopeptidase [Candidatus Fokinia crypta]|uniref:M16-like zinc-peptidase n=1 Tax=Candidatus Fokinia crypta TaxID=1920990 RepID=A0ABZ0UP77_9RICK|nr:pitrilysin family protein [Candidatus Fokinia cryptica]WPX97928.1 Putative M16-like zinc-peptidase [Candidatus Fokinia cryptica]